MLEDAVVRDDVGRLARLEDVDLVLDFVGVRVGVDGDVLGSEGNARTGWHGFGLNLPYGPKAPEEMSLGLPMPNIPFSQFIT